MFSGAVHSVRSPPPCGEGLGVGIVRFVRSWRHCHHTTPPPSPLLPQPAAGLPASGRYKSDQTPASRGLVGGGSRPSLPLALAHRIVACSFVALAALAPGPAHAAAGLDGAALRWPWALPFLGILLTIATGPLLFKRFWHRHYRKLAFIWSVLTLAPLAAVHGTPAALAAFVHTVLAEYLSFILLLFALYVVAGGILVTGELRGTPLVNTVMIAFGTLIASVVGTTGAAMILIRPLLRANAARLHNVHVVVFFIFLVANIGGALTPLGDPPLYVGF